MGYSWTIVKIFRFSFWAASFTGTLYKIYFCCNLGHLIRHLCGSCSAMSSLVNGIWHPRCSSRRKCHLRQKGAAFGACRISSAENHCHDVATCSNETSEPVHNRRPLSSKKIKWRQKPRSTSIARTSDWKMDDRQKEARQELEELHHLTSCLHRHTNIILAVKQQLRMLRSTLQTYRHFPSNGAFCAILACAKIRWTPTTTIHRFATDAIASSIQKLET